MEMKNILEGIYSTLDDKKKLVFLKQDSEITQTEQQKEKEFF